MDGLSYKVQVHFFIFASVLRTSDTRKDLTVWVQLAKFKVPIQHRQRYSFQPADATL
jgi:hypothetical protein